MSGLSAVAVCGLTGDHFFDYIIFSRSWKYIKYNCAENYKKSEYSILQIAWISLFLVIVIFALPVRQFCYAVQTSHYKLISRCSNTYIRVQKSAGTPPATPHQKKVYTTTMPNPTRSFRAFGKIISGDWRANTELSESMYIVIITAVICGKSKSEVVCIFNINRKTVQRICDWFYQ